MARRVRSLTRDEYARLLAELPEHLRDMAQFSVATGLRQANVTRLQWKQISLERRHLRVAADRHKNGRAHAVPLKRAGIEDFRWHDLRHTFATWHREAGTPTHELQRLGGGKTQSMVERYAHIAPGKRTLPMGHGAA